MSNSSDEDHLCPLPAYVTVESRRGRHLLHSGNSLERPDGSACLPQGAAPLSSHREGVTGESQGEPDPSRTGTNANATLAAPDVQGRRCAGGRGHCHRVRGSGRGQGGPAIPGSAGKSCSRSPSRPLSPAYHIPRARPKVQVFRRVKLNSL